MVSLGFGLERLGLPAIRHPRIVVAVIVVISAICGYGLTLIQSDDALSALFRADTKQFRTYQDMSDRFPVSEFDVLIVVEHPKLLDEPKLMDHVRNLTLDLPFEESVSGVLSMFSMPTAPDADGNISFLFPDVLPTGEEWQRLKERALKHPLIGGRLVVEREGRDDLVLLIVSIKPEVIRSGGLHQAVEGIQSIVDETLKPAGVTAVLSGAPVMEHEIDAAIRRDRLIYNFTGFLAGMIVNFFFFRRLNLVIIASLCPILSVLWSLGILGLVGQKFHIFINAIPPLAMVIAFSGAMHMLFSIRRQLRANKSKAEAVRGAILNVGPACVLTSLTTAIALMSLTYADSSLIRSFGTSAAVGTIATLLVVLLVVPSLVMLFLKDEKAFLQDEEKRYRAIAILEHACGRIADWITARSVSVTALFLVIVAGLTWTHLQLEPRYRLSDQVPDNKQAVLAGKKLDEALDGALPVHIMIEWQEGKTVTSPSILTLIEQAHELLEAQNGIGNVWSVHTLRRWLIERGKTTPKEVDEYLERLPVHLVARFLNRDKRASIVTGRIRNLDAEESVPLFRRIDAALHEIRALNPDVTIRVTGLSAVSASQSRLMIHQLNIGLLTAIVIVIFLIGLAFRSWRAAGLSILPNLLPIVAAGSALYMLGYGLEYASVIGLTVAFGLAVDDTVHFLNRLYLEQRRTDSLTEAVHNTVSRIGPVLVLTTIVLMLGLAVTVLSSLPPLRTFGTVAMATLAAALIADVFMLPALILTLRKWRLQYGGLRST